MVGEWEVQPGGPARPACKRVHLFEEGDKSMRDLLKATSRRLVERHE